MTRKLFYIFLLILPFEYAHCDTYTREYRYIAKPSDDIESSRAIASNELKKSLLSELGTFIRHEITIQRSETKSSAYEDIEIITSGFIAIKILEEKWNGETYYLKAELTADSKEINENAKNIRQNAILLEKIAALEKRDRELRKEIEESTKKIGDEQKVRDQHSLLIAEFSRYKKAVNNLKINNLILEGLIESNVRNNQVKACEKFVSAWDSGFDLPLLYGLTAACYDQGWHVAKDREKAITLFRKGVSDDVRDSVSFYLLILKSLVDDDLPADLKVPFEIALKRAEQVYEIYPKDTSFQIFLALQKNHSSFELINFWAERYAKHNKVKCYLADKMAEAFESGRYDNRIEAPVSSKDSVKWHLRIAEGCDGSDPSFWAGISGLNLYNRFLYDQEFKDEKKAIKYLRISAESGDAFSLFHLASLYKLGIYVDRDYRESADLFARSVKALDKDIHSFEKSRNTNSDTFVLTLRNIMEGYKHYRGIGVPIDKSKAKSTWKKEAEAISRCNRPLCLWVEIAMKELENRPKHDVMALYKHYAKYGEPNSIYDHARLSNQIK